MSITVDATYENGVLKPAQPLPLKEHEKVRVTVQSVDALLPQGEDEAAAAVRRSYGLLRWNGDRETLRRLAEDPEFDPQESA